MGVVTWHTPGYVGYFIQKRVKKIGSIYLLFSKLFRSLKIKNKKNMKKIITILCFSLLVIGISIAQPATPTAIAFEAPESPFTGDIISLHNGIASGTFTAASGAVNMVEISTLDQIGSNANMFQPIMKVLQLSDNSYYTMAITIATGDTSLIQTMGKNMPWNVLELSVGMHPSAINDIFYFMDKPGYVHFRGFVIDGNKTDLVLYDNDTEWNVIKTYNMFIERITNATNISDNEIFTAQFVDGVYMYKTTYNPTTAQIIEESINFNTVFNIDIESIYFNKVDILNNHLIIGMRAQSITTWQWNDEVYSLDLNFTNPDLDLLFETNYLNSLDVTLAISNETIGSDFVFHATGTDHWIKFPGQIVSTSLQPGLSFISLASNQVTSINLGGTLHGSSSDVIIQNSKILISGPDGIIYGPGDYDEIDGLLVVDFNEQPIIPDTVLVESISISGPVMIPVGSTYPYSINLNPDTADDMTFSVAITYGDADFEIINNQVWITPTTVGALSFTVTSTDGNASASYTVTVNDTVNNPNPNTGIGQISKENFNIYSSESGIHVEADAIDQYTFTLVNVMGQKIASGSLQNEISIPKTNGMLFLIIEDKNNNSLVHKLLY